jgi:hypothetical protein
LAVSDDMFQDFSEWEADKTEGIPDMLFCRLHRIQGVGSWFAQGEIIEPHLGIGSGQLCLPKLSREMISGQELWIGDRSTPMICRDGVHRDIPDSHDTGNSSLDGNICAMLQPFSWAVIGVIGRLFAFTF